MLGNRKDEAGTSDAACLPGLVVACALLFTPLAIKPDDTLSTPGSKYVLM